MSPETTQAAPVGRFRLAPLPGAARHSREQDRAEGYAAGYAAGAHAAAEQGAQQRALLAAGHQSNEERRDAAVQAALGSLARAARAADARTLPVVEDVQGAVVLAAVQLAEAVLGRELADGEASARAALARALSVPAELGVHTVRLAPADVAQLEALGVAAPEGVALVADPRLRPGDAVSEHQAGYLDAQVATALDRARRALLGEDA
jgi:flagellar assembly protein FliH